MDELVNSIHYKNELFAPGYIAKYGYGLSIEFIETTADFPKLEAKDIVEDSLTLKQSLCSKEFLIYGGCVASEFSFKTYNSELRAKQNISGAKIQFSIYPLKDGGVSLPEQTTALFTGWIENAVRDPITGCLQITAYDAFRRFQNTSVGDWFEDFVNRTGVDSLAIAIGTSHGAYKFKPGQKPQLRFDILEEVSKRLPGFPIVLHGASSVVPEFVEEINKYGGKMPDAIGIPEEMLRKAATMAVCKINIDSDLRLAMTAAIRKHLAEEPTHFDPRQYLKPARDAIQGMVEHKINEVLGCAGKA